MPKFFLPDTKPSADGWNLTGTRRRAAAPAVLAAFCTLAIIAFGAPAALAGPDRVALPQNYQASFVNYVDVDREDRKRVRKMYVNPEAHAAAKAGEEHPHGTVLIMEDHDAKLDADGNPVRDADGRLIPLEPVTGIFVMEKNAAWTTDNGHWDYAWYLPDGAPKPDAKFEGCFECHAGQAGEDFNFTYWKSVSAR